MSSNPNGITLRRESAELKKEDEQLVSPMGTFSEVTVIPIGDEMQNLPAESSPLIDVQGLLNRDDVQIPIDFFKKNAPKSGSNIRLILENLLGFPAVDESATYTLKKVNEAWLRVAVILHPDQGTGSASDFKQAKKWHDYLIAHASLYLHERGYDISNFQEAKWEWEDAHQATETDLGKREWWNGYLNNELKAKDEIIAQDEEVMRKFAVRIKNYEAPLSNRVELHNIAVNMHSQNLWMVGEWSDVLQELPPGRPQDEALKLLDRMNSLSAKSADLLSQFKFAEVAEAEVTSFAQKEAEEPVALIDAQSCRYSVSISPRRKCCW